MTKITIEGGEGYKTSLTECIIKALEENNFTVDILTIPLCVNKDVVLFVEDSKRRKATHEIL